MYAAFNAHSIFRENPNNNSPANTSPILPVPTLLYKKLRFDGTQQIFLTKHRITTHAPAAHPRRADHVSAMSCTRKLTQVFRRAIGDRGLMLLFQWWETREALWNFP
jgi:hypothetical protein